MRVEVTPRSADVLPTIPLTVSITIANTSSVIGGYTIRVLGADPGWVELETDQVSMFPDETRTVAATVTVPLGIPAGVRRIAVQVRELTPPFATTVAEIDLTVPSERSVTARLDPLAVTGGGRGRFTVLVENHGNTVVRAELAAEDPEGVVRCRFQPDLVVLAPGEHAVVDMEARGKRPKAGPPSPRIISLFLDERPADPFFADPAEAAQPSHDENKAVATGTFIQRPVMSRGLFALIGLLAAITVFAVVITIAMSKLVGQSAADRNLALQIAAAQQSGGPGSGSASVAGTVTLLTSGRPISGVSVTLYSSSDTSNPIATTATDQAGAYKIGNLDAGSYKLTFRGAEFLQLWYPTAANASDATSIRVAAGQSKGGIDVTVGGIPATISGTVKGDDLTGATLYLEKAPTGGATANSVVVPTPTSGTPPGIPPDTGDAIVETVPVGSDGSFTLSNVPSPNVYVLVLAKPGYATSTQTINVGPGEDRTSVQLLLRKGDGIISGTVTSSTGPLGDVTLTASSGSSTASTVSLTDQPPGSFTLGNLPTPGTYTLVASKDGYASQAITLSLAAGQKLTGVSVTLVQSSGSLSGLVTIAHPPPAADTPGAGVSVTVTDGVLTVQTETQSTDPKGSWSVSGLPVPGTYTVTFVRADLGTQTVSVTLDAQGQITPLGDGVVTTAGLQVRMRSATATVFGTVEQPNGSTVCGSANQLGEAQVTLSSGTSTYRVTTASVPASLCGQFRIENMPPGTYTATVQAGAGTIPDSQVLQLNAGDVVRLHSPCPGGGSNCALRLSRPASITGSVLGTDGATCRSGWSVFLYLAAQYPQTLTATATTAGPGSPQGCGSFTFPRIDAGTYVIAVGPTSDPVNTVKTVRVSVQPSEQYGTVQDGTSLVIEADPGA